MSWDNRIEVYLLHREPSEYDMVTDEKDLAFVAINSCWDGDKNILQQIRKLETFCRAVRESIKKEPDQLVLRTNQ